MEPPESVVIGLRNVRDSLDLRWNPTARLVKPGSYDASGSVIPGEFEGRFELWDKIDGAPEYMITRWQNPDGSFRPADERLVEYINLINPANWDGDPDAMIEHFVDNPTELREKVDDADADDVLEMAARWSWDSAQAKSRVMTDNCAALETV